MSESKRHHTASTVKQHNPAEDYNPDPEWYWNAVFEGLNRACTRRRSSGGIAATAKDKRKREQHHDDDDNIPAGLQSLPGLFPEPHPICPATPPIPIPVPQHNHNAGIVDPHCTQCIWHYGISHSYTHEQLG